MIKGSFWLQVFTQQTNWFCTFREMNEMFTKVGHLLIEDLVQYFVEIAFTRRYLSHIEEEFANSKRRQSGFIAVIFPVKIVHVL